MPDSRLAKDGRSLAKEEKFDTWLDLAKLLCLQSKLQEIDDWSEWSKNVNHWNPSSDTLAMLSVSEVPISVVMSSVVTPCLPSMIIEHILSHPPSLVHRQSSAQGKNYRRIKVVTQMVVAEQINHLGTQLSTTLKDLIQPGLEVWTDKIHEWPAEIYWVYTHLEQWMKVISTYKRLFAYRPEKTPFARAKFRCRNNHNTLPILNKGGIITLTHDLAVLTFKGKFFLLSEELLLECYNKIAELYCLLIFNHYQSGTVLPDNQYEMALRLTKYITHHISKHVSYKVQKQSFTQDNKGFGFIKIIEGLGVSEIIRRSDSRKGWINEDLQQTLWRSAHQEDLTDSEDFQGSDLAAIWADMSIPQIADLLGIVKIAGHPAIDVEGGLNQLYERTHANIRVDPEAVEASICTITRDLFRNFYRRHKKYPNHKIHGLPGNSALLRILGRNIDPTSALGGQLWTQIPHRHWSRVEIQKTEEFDPIDNQLVLLKDKSLGIMRSKVMQHLFHCNPNRNMKPIDVSERRALLKYLLSSHFSDTFRGYLDTFQEDEEWADTVLDYLVIKLTPKELELKEFGRMFGASPPEERNRRIVQEMNCMCLMDNYTPDQLMTPNELLTLKKMFSFRYLSKLYPDSVVFQVSFDFSKWNNNMRSASIDVPALRILDAWFGTKIYGKTMKAYENALVYYADSNTRRYWDGQLGGIEGLNQATWSFIFVGGIKSALEKLGVLCQISVKGDDVRAALIVPNRNIRRGIPRSEALHQKKNEILHELEVLCHQMGWELKPEESFVSLSVIATSKQYQVNDTWLPAASKKIMKAMSLSNVLFPTLEDIIGSIYSNSHSACSQTTAFLPSYILATSVASHTIIRELGHLTTNDVHLAVLLMWPQVLSGPGGLPLQTFFVRGENDMLSISVSLFRSLTRSTVPELADVAKTVLRTIQFDDPDLHLLVTDPYAIPIVAPPRPSSLLKSLLRAAMKKWVKNPDLATLLTLSAKQDADDLKDTLLTMTPYYAKLVTMIWECTPFYIIDEVVAKFMQSSTVIAFLARGKAHTTSARLAHRALSRIVDASEKRLNFWLTTVKKISLDDDSLLGVIPAIWDNHIICTTEVVHYIRKGAWGRDIYGLTYPSLVDQNVIIHPSDAARHFNSKLMREGLSHITLMPDLIQMETDEQSYHYASNPRNIPWLGSSTSSKIKFLDGPLIYRSTTLTKISRLITLRRLGEYYGKDFCKLLERIMSGLTSLPMRDLTLLTPEVPFGHIAHRGTMNSFSLTTMPNFRPNFSQLVSINNESLTILRKDTANRTINFAARNFYLIAMALFPLQSARLLPSLWPTTILSYIHHDIRNSDEYALCPFCANVVDDVPLNIDLDNLPTLSHYSELNCVGASEFDEKALKAQAEVSIAGKVKRYLVDQQFDSSNPLNIARASRIVLRKIMTDSSRVFAEAQHAQFTQVPSGALLDIMSVSLGFKSLNASGISLNVIRAIPPNILYNILTEQVFAWVYRQGTDITHCDQIWSLNLIQRHLDPLRPTFDFLSLAGVYHKIATGCAVSNLTDISFSWPHGSANDGNIASRYFLSYHFPLFGQWLSGEGTPPSGKLYLSMEDDDAVRNSLEQDATRLYKTVARYCDKCITVRPASHYITKMVAKSCRAFWKGNTHITESMCITAAVGLVKVEKKKILSEVGLTPQSTTERWGVLIYILSLPFLCKLGDWSEGINFHTLQGGESISLITSNDDWDGLLPPYQSSTIENIELYSWLLERLNKHQQHVLWEMSRQLLSDESIFPCLYPIIELLGQGWPMKFAWANRCQLQVMTDEDAERVIRISGHSLESYIEEYGCQPDEVNPEDHPDTAVQCPWANEHPSINDPTECRVNQSIDLLIGWYEQMAEDALPKRHELKEAWGYQVEPSQFYRCVGGINASGAKWWWILYKSRVVEMMKVWGPRSLILCIGDGGGSMSYSLLKSGVQSKILLCTLAVIPSSGHLQNDYNPSNIPYEFLSEVKQPELSKKIDHTSLYPGDINSDTCQALVSAHAHDAVNNIDAVLVDIDWDRSLPYEKYIKSLLNSWRAAVSNTNDSSFLLMKIKVDSSYWFFHLVFILYSSYNHRHLIENPVSSLRDFELFFIGTDPLVGEIATMDILGYVEGLTTCRISEYFVGEILQQCDRLSNNLYNWTGVGVPVLRSFPILFDFLEDSKVHLPALQRLVTPLGIQVLNCNTDVCHIPLIIETSLQQYLHVIAMNHATALSSMYQTDQDLVPSHVPPLQLKKGAPLAKGPSGVGKLLEKMGVTTCALSLFRSLLGGDFDWAHSLERTLQDLMKTLAPYLQIHQSHAKWLYKNGVHVIVVGNYIICANLLISDVLRHVLRLMGFVTALHLRILQAPKRAGQEIDTGAYMWVTQDCCRGTSQNWVRWWRHGAVSTQIPYLFWEPEGAIAEPDFNTYPHKEKTPGWSVQAARQSSWTAPMQVAYLNNYWSLAGLTYSSCDTWTDLTSQVMSLCSNQPSEYDDQFDEHKYGSDDW